MHYLYRYVCILNFFYICIWTIVCNKDIIIIMCKNLRCGWGNFFDTGVGVPVNFRSLTNDTRAGPLYDVFSHGVPHELGINELDGRSDRGV